MTEPQDDEISRRSVMGGVGVGLTAMAAAPGLAQSDAERTAASRNPSESQRRVDAYPRPPFPEQSQPWPGLTGRMTPRPDHGETSYRGSGRLAGRRALITGGDSGIGRAVAIAFAREGADVAIAYLPQEEPDAREVVRLIETAGRRAVRITGDLAVEATCRRIVADAVRGLGGLDILVNNAGVQVSRAGLEELTSDQFDRTMKVNVYAPFWLIKAALPHLGRGGSIINTASGLGYSPVPQFVDYSATKAAIINMTKSMAMQLAARGVRVNAVAPGPVWTPFTVTAGSPDEFVRTFGSGVPAGRPGQPAELASIYVQLADASAGFSNGQVFGATGGNGVA